MVRFSNIQSTSGYSFLSYSFLPCGRFEQSLCNFPLWLLTYTSPFLNVIRFLTLHYEMEGVQYIELPSRYTILWDNARGTSLFSLQNDPISYSYFDFDIDGE